MASHFQKRLSLPVSAETLFGWHARPGAFERLSPPWDDVRLERDAEGIADGHEVLISVPAGPLRIRWLARYRDVVPGRSFTDVQVRGPFAAWAHTHRMIAVSENQSVLEDSITYALPLNFVTRPLAGWALRRQLQQLFAWRHRVTLRDLCRLNRENPPMRILVTGASGLVGSALVPFLRTGGHDVVIGRRSGAKEDGVIRWDPATGLIDKDLAEGLDAVIHLAGVGIADKRWTDERKHQIVESRVPATTKLCQDLAALTRPPKTFVCASAIGYYGNRPDGTVDESSAPGTGFLPETCQAWEAACAPARNAGNRVVNTRFGIILSPKGGALGKMLPPFRFGLGGPLGNGRQMMSWISIEDTIRALEFVTQTTSVKGPVNFTAPSPVSNREFTKTLGHVLKRPAFLPAPAFALKIALGPMAEPLLLEGADVRPNALSSAGYTFVHPSLEAALRELLGKMTNLSNEDRSKIEGASSVNAGV